MANDERPLIRVPDVLFQYCSERSINIFEENRIKSSTPSTLNDPFEWKPVVAEQATADRPAEDVSSPHGTRDTSVERVRQLYRYRQRRFKIRAGKIEDEDGLEQGSLLYQRMMHEIYAAQRHALVGLRNNRQISSDVMRRVERELDLEESRLEV